MRPPNAEPEDTTLAVDPAHEHRVERYGYLGFTEVEAELLATRKTPDGIYVYWGEVDRALTAGATRDQIMACYA